MEVVASRGAQLFVAIWFCIASDSAQPHDRGLLIRVNRLCTVQILSEKCTKHFLGMLETAEEIAQSSTSPHYKWVCWTYFMRFDVISMPLGQIIEDH